MGLIQYFDPRNADMGVVLGTGFGVNLLAFAGVGIALVNPYQGEQNWSNFATQSGEPPTDYSKVLQAMEDAKKAQPWEVALMQIKPELPPSSIEFANAKSKVVEPAKPTVKTATTPTIKAKPPIAEAAKPAIQNETRLVSYPPKPATTVKPTPRPNIAPPEVFYEPTFSPTPKASPKVDPKPTPRPDVTPKPPEEVAPLPTPTPTPTQQPPATLPEVVPQPTPEVVVPQVQPTPKVSPTP
jgi:hypothetical protein